MKYKRHIVLIITITLLLCAEVQSTFCHAEDSIDGVPVCTSVEDAGKALREAMTERDEVVRICLLTDTIASESEPIIDEIFEKALRHTGDPEEGDYLRFQYDKCTASADTVSADGSDAVLITYYINYYTNAEQEKATDEKVNMIIDGLDLDGKTEREKIDAVYDYLCSNVTYDYEHWSDSDYMLKRSAYAALVDGRAVCQGYCVALYRLLLAAGIDNRIIYGTGYRDRDEGVDHTWNLVDLYGEYYNVDVTWDASDTDRKYYLKSDESFRRDHIRSEEYDTASLAAGKDCEPEDGNTAFTAMAGTLVRAAARALSQ